VAFSKNIILFISANVCVIYCLLGQSPGLHGYIYDKETSEPLIGASILLEGTSFGSATDITGNYHISGIPVGTYNLQIGPQVRYQVFSTYRKELALIEKPYAVGLKFGLTKGF